jgi:PIN domain nuclease of toxin-antitoxin system
MTTYVTDTHALLWYLSGSAQLTDAARSAFDEAVRLSGEVIVPAIVLAEAVMLIEKRRVSIDINRIVTTLNSTAGFQLVPLLPETVIHISSLTMIPDIHDRLIVAEAIQKTAILITKDRMITASGLVPTLWE